MRAEGPDDLVGDGDAADSEIAVVAQLCTAGGQCGRVVGARVPVGPPAHRTAAPRAPASPAPGPGGDRRRARRATLRTMTEKTRKWSGRSSCQ